MDRSFRAFMLVLAIVQGIVGLGFAFQIPFITQIWPIPNTSPLSLIFIGSIFLAAAASTFWCLYAGENGSLAGIFLDYIVIAAPLVIYFIMISSGNSGMLFFAGVLLLTVLFGLFGMWWALRHPIKDTRPQPMPARIAFAVFVVALILVGGGLVMQRPGILPWAVTPEGSVIYGCMFLGAAAYFVYALMRPSWMNSGGQLAGFLAYDLVLIIPFIGHFSKVPPELMPNLIIYTAVLVISGLLAAYYLFVNKETRIPLSSARSAARPAGVGLSSDG